MGSVIQLKKQINNSYFQLKNSVENKLMLVEEKIKSINGDPILRTLGKGYPFFTQNGNLVIDAHFGEISEPKVLEQSLLNIPGIIANGIFSMPIDTFLRANNDGTVDTL